MKSSKLYFEQRLWSLNNKEQEDQAVQEGSQDQVAPVGQVPKVEVVVQDQVNRILGSKGPVQVDQVWAEEVQVDLVEWVDQDQVVILEQEEVDQALEDIQVVLVDQEVTQHPLVQEVEDQLQVRDQMHKIALEIYLEEQIHSVNDLIYRFNYSKYVKCRFIRYLIHKQTFQLQSIYSCFYLYLNL